MRNLNMKLGTGISLRHPDLFVCSAERPTECALSERRCPGAEPAAAYGTE